MKKILGSVFIPVLVFALIIGGVPAFAADTPTGNATAVKPPVISSVLRGTVTAVSGSVIKIGAANVTVVPATKYLVPGLKNATLSDIKVGMNVTVQTEKINGEPYAVLVTVIPVVRHYVGNITAYGYTVAIGGSISIKDSAGKIYSFKIAAGEFTILPQGVVVKVGDHVTVSTRQTTDAAEPVAFEVVVSIPLEHFSGNVTAFSYTPAKGGTISIKDKSGKTLTFSILADKFSVQPAGANVKVGSQVIVTVRTTPGVAPVAIGVEVVIPTEHFTGNVTAFSYDVAKGGKLAIVGKDGKKFNFDIEAGKFSVMPKDASVKVGDIVTVVAKVMEDNHLIATGVVIQPKPVSVKGVITKIDTTGKTITIGATVVGYNTKTTFLLHGVLSVNVGMQATATGLENPDHTIVAGTISVATP
jgi:hypothetical protein